MPEEAPLATWRQTLAALANAVRLVEAGALSPDDDLFVIALEAEHRARQTYLRPPPADPAAVEPPPGPMPRPASAVPSSAGLRRRVATNLPGDPGRSVTSWPLGTIWTTVDASTDVGSFVVQVMNAAPNRPRQDTDGLLKRASAVAAASTPPEATRAVGDFRSYAGQVFAGVVTAAELIDAVDVISRHLHSGR